MDNKKATKGKRFDLWGCTKTWKICTMHIFLYLYSFDSFFLSPFLSLSCIGAVKLQHVLLIPTSLLVIWYRGPNQDTAGIATHGSRWSGADKCAKCYRGLPLSCISLCSFELKANWKRALTEVAERFDLIAFLFNLTQFHNKETGCFYWILAVIVNYLLFKFQIDAKYTVKTFSCVSKRLNFEPKS